ncbi:MAG: GNAT family N-acetyltransferase [Verrucomicrobia bacterium]|nr:GNAT family N-acetyltransferase [Verrucomicrobiota bacterium]
MERQQSSFTCICTPRLLLREFVTADFPAVHALLSCPQVMEFSPTGPLSSAQCRDRLDGFITAYAEYGFGKWAIVTQELGEVIGYCGLELTAIDGPPVPELGFRLRAESWGQGYATEAARGALDHGFDILGFRDLLAFVEPANFRSVRVLTKLGFAFQRSAQWHGHPVDIFQTSNENTQYSDRVKFPPVKFPR